MLLHLVGSGELLKADRAGEDLALLALVVEEGVPLEAILVLERLEDLHFVALEAAVGAVTGDLGVAQQVQSPHRHV